MGLKSSQKDAAKWSVSRRRGRQDGQLNTVQSAVGRKGDRCIVREIGDSLLLDTSCGVWEEIAKRRCAEWGRDRHGPVWVGKGPGKRRNPGQDPESQRIERGAWSNGRYRGKIVQGNWERHTGAGGYGDTMKWIIPHSR